MVLFLILPAFQMYTIKAVNSLCGAESSSQNNPVTQLPSEVLKNLLSTVQIHLTEHETKARAIICLQA